jgi:hypothetical protein
MDQQEIRTPLSEHHHWREESVDSADTGEV